MQLKPYIDQAYIFGLMGGLFVAIGGFAIVLSGAFPIATFIGWFAFATGAACFSWAVLQTLFRNIERRLIDIATYGSSYKALGDVSRKLSGEDLRERMIDLNKKLSSGEITRPQFEKALRDLIGRDVVDDTYN